MAAKLSSSGQRRVTIGVILLFGVICLGFAIRHADRVEVDAEVLNFFVSERTLNRTAFMRAVTVAFAPGTSAMWAVGLGVVVGWVARSWAQGLVIPVSMGLSALATAGFKEVIERVRPPEAQRLVVELSHSFPSGHTTAAAALFVSAALLLMARLKRLRRLERLSQLEADLERRYEALSLPKRVLIVVWAAVVLLVALVAVSRLYLAAHWLTDIIGGALMGTGVALIVFAVLVDRRPRE